MYVVFAPTFRHTLERVSIACIVDCVKLSLTHDLDNELWPVIWPGRDVLDFPQCEHPVNHFTENYVLSV